MRDSYNKEIEEKIAEILHSDKSVRWVHERYLEDNPKELWSTPWVDLPENIKEANRNQVKSIPQKLLAVGCEIAAISTDSCVEYFSPHEIKALARIEHDRWMLEKVSEGWLYGKEREEAKKLHPSIVPWEELPKTEKQKNISTVKNIIPLLKKVGLCVVRF